MIKQDWNFAPRRQRFLCVLLSLAACDWQLAAQSVPASWKKSEGKFFAFSHPANWRLVSVNEAHVQILDPDTPGFSMQFEHTTAYGSNIETMLAAERADIERSAREAGVGVTFEGGSGTYALRGGRSISASFNNNFGIILYAEVNGVAIGKSIYIIRTTVRPVDSSAETQYRRPIINSMAFRVPRESIIGTYTCNVAQNQMSGLPVTPRLFDATLTLNSDGQYTYTVRQTRVPVWDFQVTGNWSVTDPSPVVLESAAQITLVPSTVRSPTTISAGEFGSELSRLAYEGFPVAVNESLAIVTPSPGKMDFRQLNGRTSHFEQSSGPIATPTPTPTPTIQVSDAAAFTAGPVAPGSLISLFGSFGVAESVASRLPLPFTLSQVSATVSGVAAPLLFVSGSQVNLQVPFETPNGVAPVTVTKNGTAFATGSVSITRAAPKLFISTGNHAIAAHQDFTLNSSGNPARAGSYLTVYITGQGPLLTPVENGAAAPSSPLAYTAASTTATIGGRPASVVFSGAAPGFAGVAQINIQVPTGLSRGDFPLVVTIGGVASNAANVSIAP